MTNLTGAIRSTSGEPPLNSGNIIDGVRGNNEPPPGPAGIGRGARRVVRPRGRGQAVNIYGTAGRRSVVSGTNLSSATSGVGVVSNGNQISSTGCSNVVSSAQFVRNQAGQQQQQQQQQVPSQGSVNRSMSSVERREISVNIDNNIDGQRQQPTARQVSLQRPDLQGNRQSQNGEPGSDFVMTSSSVNQNSAPLYVGASTSADVTSDDLLQGTAAGENFMLTNNSFPNLCIPPTNLCASYTPLTSICSSLGDHLPQAIINKIVGGEYVEFVSLLDRSDIRDSGNGGMTLSVNQGGNVVWAENKPKRIIHSIHVWTDAFLIFSSIFLKAHPLRAQELLKYASLIRTAASRFGGYGWRTYDFQFRMRQQRRPSNSWAVIDGELWTLYVSTPIHRGFQNKPSGSQSGGGQSASFRSQFGQGKDAGGKREFFCHAFNAGGCSRSGQHCRYPHKCSKCQGFGHGAKACVKK
jgi:hypothetical protein